MLQRLLAIDTSSEACSVALACAGEHYYQHVMEPRKHAELVLPMVDALLAEAEITLSQLDGIAVGIGPGSFTGLRIAVGIVQGLAFGADVPIVPVSSLALLAHQVFRLHQYSHCHVAVDARMGEVYWGRYYVPQSGLCQLLGQEQVAAPNSIAVVDDAENENIVPVGVGSGWKYADILASTTGKVHRLFPDIQPHALDLLSVGTTLWQQQQVVTPDQLRPVYLRNNVAVKPNRTQ